MSLFDLSSTRRFRAQRQRTGWIGIEICANAIKIAQVELIAGQYRMARSLVVPTESNRRFDEQSIEQGHVGRRLRESLSLHGGFQGRLAACALSMDFCELRTLVSAQCSQEERRELIRLELGDESAGPREFDFWDAHGDEGHHELTQVNVLSVSQATADGVATNLLHAGLKCQVLDGIPFTALRAWDMISLPPSIDEEEQAVVMLDWGYSKATVVVVCDGEPMFTRTLRNCGLQRLLEKICQQLQLSLVEAESMLVNFGVAHPAGQDQSSGEIQQMINTLAAEVITDLVNELNETLEFVKLQFAGLTPASMCLIGAGANVRNISAQLDSLANVATTSWDLPGPTSDPNQSPAAMATAAALSALAWE